MAYPDSGRVFVGGLADTVTQEDLSAEVRTARRGPRRVPRRRAPQALARARRVRAHVRVGHSSRAECYGVSMFGLARSAPRAIVG